ncbi:unnamed protein product [Blepharisma stoltei]|uniref:Uncharacterized protein n=1 Tax=Blepharisma stoltei TaxID=1481888 RepID=A0AAU9JYF7_9CILI|nr:unnamed protein product [Blepharisma stoltei]
MLLTTIFCITILLIPSTQANTDSFLGLLESENLYHQVSSCPIGNCKYTQSEIDSRGQSWPTYCYSCTDGEEEVTFRKMYSPMSWTYYTSQAEGNPNYQFRVIEQIERCIGNNVEIDKQGKSWKLWCYENGSNVKFEITGDENNWTYLEDYDSGYSRYEYRRIIGENMVFLEEKNEDEGNLFLMISADDDEDLNTYFLENSRENVDSDEIVGTDGNITISSDINDILSPDYIENLGGIEEEIYEMDMETSLQNEGSASISGISEEEEEESEIFEESLNNINATAGEEESIPFDENDFKNQDFASKENIIENFSTSSFDLDGSSDDLDESSTSFDKNTVETDFDESLVDTLKSSTDHNEASIDIDKIPIEVDENPVNIDEGPITTDGNSTIEAGENSVKDNENSVYPYESSVSIDESSASIDESSVNIDKSSGSIDKSSGNIDGSSADINESSRNNENLANFEKSSVFSGENVNTINNATTGNHEEELINAGIENNEQEEIEDKSTSIDQESETSPIAPQKNTDDDDDIVCFDNQEPLEASISIPNDEEFVYTPVKQVRPFDIIPPVSQKDTDNPCFNLERDRSGRYFIKHYTENNTSIEYEKDQNDNYIWDSLSLSRVPKDKSQEIEEIDVSNIDLLCICPLYDNNGKLIELEQDRIQNGIFWEVNYEGENKIKYLPSISEEEKSQGMYMIDNNTGFRLRMFQ